MHKHSLKHTHTHSHTQAHTYIHTHTHTLHTHTHTHIHTQAHTHIQLCTHPNKYKHPHTRRVCTEGRGTGWYRPRPAGQVPGLSSRPWTCPRHGTYPTPGAWPAGPRPVLCAENSLARRQWQDKWELTGSVAQWEEVWWLLRPLPGPAFDSQRFQS
jgi:hypothetical protein